MDVPVPERARTELVAVELGEYELEEPWGRLAELARRVEHVALDGIIPAPSAPIRTFAIQDRISRASSISCKSVEDAVRLVRFLDAHLAEARRFLLDRADPALARLRGLEADARGAVCCVSWSFSTGDADALPATAASVSALHDGFLGQLAPVPLVGAVLEPEVRGGKGVLAASRLGGEGPFPAGVHATQLEDGIEASVRLDVTGPAGPGYRLVQLEAARVLARALDDAKGG